MLTVDNTDKLIAFHWYISFAGWFCLLCDELYTLKPIHPMFENEGSDRERNWNIGETVALMPIEPVSLANAANIRPIQHTCVID